MVYSSFIFIQDKKLNTVSCSLQPGLLILQTLSQLPSSMMPDMERLIAWFVSFDMFRVSCSCLLL